jgi:hypothetical protein
VNKVFVAKQGVRDDTEDCSDMLRWWVYRTSDVSHLTDQDIRFWDGRRPSYGGPGRWFDCKPCVKRGRNWTLVKQRCGYDI